MRTAHGDPPPRHQAIEPAARRQRQRVAGRFRPGQDAGGRGPHQHRRRTGHDPVHGAGTIQRALRRAVRRLWAGLDLVRAGGAPAGVRGGRSVRADRGGSPCRAGATEQAGAGRLARPGDDHPQGDRARAGSALCQRRRAGRGPAEVPGRSADPARRVSIPERFLRWCRRNPWAAAFSLALGLGAIASTWQAVRATAAERAARESELRRATSATTPDGPSSGADRARPGRGLPQSRGGRGRRAPRLRQGRRVDGG